MIAFADAAHYRHRSAESPRNLFDSGPVIHAQLEIVEQHEWAPSILLRHVDSASARFRTVLTLLSNGTSA